MTSPDEAWLLARARELRNHSTLAEVLLWKHLKGKQRCGYDFHRQRTEAGYILDFFAPKLRLAIEVDGVTHDCRTEADAARDAVLKARGITVLRFGEREVKRDAQEVARRIDEWIMARGYAVLSTDSNPHTPARPRHPSC